MQSGKHGVFHADAVAHSPTHFARGNAYEQSVIYPVSDAARHQQQRPVLRCFSDAQKQPSAHALRTEQVLSHTSGLPAFFLKNRPPTGPLVPASPVHTPGGRHQLAFDAAVGLHDVPPRRAGTAPSRQQQQQQQQGHYDHWRSHYGRTVQRPSSQHGPFAHWSLPRGAARRHHAVAAQEDLLEASRVARERGFRETPRHLHSLQEKRAWERARQAQLEQLGQADAQERWWREQQQHYHQQYDQQRQRQHLQRQHRGNQHAGGGAPRRERSRGGREHHCEGCHCAPASRPGSGRGSRSTHSRHKRASKPAGVRTGRPYTSSSVTSSVPSSSSSSSSAKDYMIGALRTELAALRGQYADQRQRRQQQYL